MIDELIEEKEIWDTPAVLREKILHLSEDIKEIKMDHREVSKKIDDLQNIILQSGKPNWVGLAIIFGVLITIMVGMSNLAFDPIRSDITLIKETLKTIVPREEHMNKWAEYDKEIIRLQDSIKSLDSSKMGREELEELKATINARIEELNSRLKRR
jgi:uncharacterized coiled-coil DUF342 family protein